MSRYLRTVVWDAVPVAVLSAATAGVSSRPRQRPIDGGAPAAGPGSLESVRRQLEGKQPEGEFASLPSEMLARRERASSFDGDLLTLTVGDSVGRTTAVNTWRPQAK